MPVAVTTIGIRRHRSGRFDGADVGLFQISSSFAVGVAPRLELDRVGLAGCEPADLLRDRDVAGRRAHVDHAAMRRRVQAELAVVDALDLQPALAGGSKGELVTVQPVTPLGAPAAEAGSRSSCSQAEVAVHDQVARRPSQDRHVVVDRDRQRTVAVSPSRSVTV